MNAGSSRKLCSWHLFVLSIYNRLKAWEKNIEQRWVDDLSSLESSKDNVIIAWEIRGNLHINLLNLVYISFKGWFAMTSYCYRLKQWVQMPGTENMGRTKYHANTSWECSAAMPLALTVDHINTISSKSASATEFWFSGCIWTSKYKNIKANKQTIIWEIHMQFKGTIAQTYSEHY